MKWVSESVSHSQTKLSSEAEVPQGDGLCDGGGGPAAPESGYSQEGRELLMLLQASHILKVAR